MPSGAWVTETMELSPDGSAATPANRAAASGRGGIPVATDDETSGSPADPSIDIIRTARNDQREFAAMFQWRNESGRAEGGSG